MSLRLLDLELFVTNDRRGIRPCTSLYRSQPINFHGNLCHFRMTPGNPICRELASCRGSRAILCSEADPLAMGTFLLVIDKRAPEVTLVNSRPQSPNLGTGFVSMNGYSCHWGPRVLNEAAVRQFMGGRVLH